MSYLQLVLTLVISVVGLRLTYYFVRLCDNVRRSQAKKSWTGWIPVVEAGIWSSLLMFGGLYVVERSSHDYPLVAVSFLEAVWLLVVLSAVFGPRSGQTRPKA